MKKHSLIAIVLGALVLPLMVSCTKPDDDGPSTPVNPDNPENPINPDNPIDPIIPDTPEDIMGVYNPGKKIQKVYESDSYTAKYLREAWNWNGNKLEYIDHYRKDGFLDYREQYYYDDNRIVRVVSLGGNYESVTAYGYEGNYLKTAVVSEGGVTRVKFAFVYDGNKIIGYNIISDCKNTVSSLGDAPNYVQLVWTEDNVTSMVAFDNNVELARTNLLYDGKNNPMKRFLNSNVTLLVLDDDFLNYGLCMSRNNVVMAYLPSKENISYIYQYDGDGYPIEVTVSMGYTTYYEYE